MIYLDNAATSGHKPREVIRAVNNALTRFCANPGRSGHSLSLKASELVFGVRSKISRFVNSNDQNTVCFTGNCTHAINVVLHGALKKGDHAIISSLEHNAVYRPINYIMRNKGVEYDIADVDMNDDSKTVENIESKIKPSTKLIFLTAASNVFGKRLPIKTVGELCRSRGILFAVDGAQAVGIIPIDMKEMNIDYLCIAPHKGLYAPMGVGVLVAERGIEDVLISGGTGSASAEVLQPDELPDRVESGTVNLPGIAGCGAGIDFVNSIGIDKIHSKEMEFCKTAYRGLKGLGAKLYTEEPDVYGYVPVLSFNLGSFNSEAVGSYLSDHSVAVRSGLHCAPLAHRSLNTLETGTVRIAPSLYNTACDAEKMIFLLKRLI